MTRTRYPLPGSVLGGGSSGNAVPITQTFALANNAYKAIYEWTVTGQTDDPLPSFGLVAGSQTYSWSTGGETTQGPLFVFGYNPEHLSGMVPSSPHAAIGISSFADAGDSWNPATGGHGLEFNIAWSSPTGAKGVAPVQVVGLDDETRTVTLALRCGDGQFTNHDGGQYSSGITMSDAAGNSYLAAGPFNNQAYGSVAAGTQPGLQIGVPVAMTSLPYLYGLAPGKMTALFNATGAAGNGSLSWSGISNSDTVAASWQSATGTTHTVYSTAGPSVTAVTSGAGLATSSLSAAGAGNAAKFQATSTAGTAQFILNGNTSTSAQMVFQRAGTNTWVLQDLSGTDLFLTNNSGQLQMFMVSGSNAAPNYDNAQTVFPSKVNVNGSFAVDNGGTALATTATKGFLYVPAVSGAPTGTPVANAGSVATAWDSTNKAVNVYDGAAWEPQASQAYVTASTLSVQATTGTTGFTLANGTSTVLSWTAPNDGLLHRVLVHAGLHVTSTETGGAISLTITQPDGSIYPATMYAGGSGSGAVSGVTIAHPVKAGTAVVIAQSSALTAGAAIMWAEILGF